MSRTSQRNDTSASVLEAFLYKPAMPMLFGGMTWAQVAIAAGSTALVEAAFLLASFILFGGGIAH